MGKTQLLFDVPKGRRVKRMSVIDAGHGPGGKVIRFKCFRCGHDTGWLPDNRTVTENKRGIPCPKCNKSN